MHPLPALYQPGRKRGEKGGSENPISKINSWAGSSEGSPSLSKYPSSSLGWSCLSVREKCLSKTKTWEPTEWYPRGPNFMSMGFYKENQKWVFQQLMAGRRHKCTHSRSSANPKQTEDTAHSWTSLSKRLKPEDKYQHLDRNQSKPHVSWRRNDAQEMTKLCKVLWGIYTYNGCSLAVVSNEYERQPIGSIVSTGTSAHCRILEGSGNFRWWGPPGESRSLGGMSSCVCCFLSTASWRSSRWPHILPKHTKANGGLNPYRPQLK